MGQGEGKDQGGAKGAKKAKGGEQGAFLYRFLGSPPPVGVGEQREQTGRERE